jgi:hypothetical protein
LSAIEAGRALTAPDALFGAFCGVVSAWFGRGKPGLACGYACGGGEGEGDEDDGEYRNKKVGGHVASLVIVVIGHGDTRTLQYATAHEKKRFSSRRGSMTVRNYNSTRRHHVHRPPSDMGPRASTRCQGRLETVLGARHGRAHQAQVSVRPSTRVQHALTLVARDRQPGQTSTGEVARRDLRADLLIAEEEARNKKRKAEGKPPVAITRGAEDEDTLKRRKLLQEALELDRDDDEDEDDVRMETHEESEDESEDEDDTDELLRELEKIKRERAEEQARQEREQLASQAAQLGPSPGLNTTIPGTFSVKKRWDDGRYFATMRGVFHDAF